MNRKALEDLGERIAEQAAHLDAATHRMLTDLRAFDQGGGWYQQGARSCAQWLSWRLGWGLGVAREHVRVASRLGELPLTDAALHSGELSYCKVRAITRVATPAIEAEIVEQARFTTGAQLEQICRKYAAVVRHDTDRNPNDDRQQRCVRMRDTADGMACISMILHPDEASMVWAAIERLAVARCRESVSAETAKSKSHRSLPKSVDRADAIVAHAQGILRGDRIERSPVDVVLMVPAETLTSTAAPEVASSVAGLGSNGTGVGSATSVSSAANLSNPTTRVAAGASNPAMLKEARVGAEASSSTTSPVARVGAEASRSTTSPVACVGSDASNPATQEARIGAGASNSATPQAARVGAGASNSATPEVSVACFADGNCVSAETARRLSCDCGLTVVHADDRGVPLSVGRRRRTIPPAMKRALLRRDQTCRFPGCNTRVFLEGHHRQHWASGGATSLDNAICLCGYHHRFVHEYRYTIEGSGGDVQFRDPYGRIVVAAPAPAQPANRGFPAIEAQNRDLSITPNTSGPGCDGSRISYWQCIDVLVRAEDRHAAHNEPSTVEKHAQSIEHAREQG
jgi:hypothetical protein